MEGRVSLLIKVDGPFEEQNVRLWRMRLVMHPSQRLRYAQPSPFVL